MRVILDDEHGSGSRDPEGEGPARRRRVARADRLALVALIALLIASTGLALLFRDNFFLRDDMQDQYLGGYAEVVRAWRSGEAPLVSLLSWQSGALAGEYQYGVFSPFLTACNLLLFGLGLPLTAIATLLVLIHLAVLSCGAYVLARSEAIPPPLAMMVALAGAMNGWMVEWGVNWFPALASFAWVPWAWWAMKRALERGERRWVLAAGVFIALIATAGWPYTCLMIGLVGFVLAARAMRREQSFQPLARAALCGAVGLGLSAPALLMLVEYSGATMRGQASSPLALQTDFLVPLKAYLGMVLPSIKAPWSIPWRPPGESGSLVMHVGLAPVALLVTAALAFGSRLFKELAGELLFLLLLCYLATFPSFGIFKWSFRWLPLLFLQLALVAGHAGRRLLERDDRAGRPRFRPGAVSLALVLLAIGASLLIDPRLPASVPRLWLILAAITALWWVLESLPGARGIHRHLPWLVVFLTSISTFGLLYRGYDFHLWHRPVDASAEPPFEPGVTYLALYSQESYSSAPIRYPGQRYYPGNEHMHSGLRFVNGYSPMLPAGTTRLFGFNYIGALSTRDPPRARRLGPILKRMAVDGLVTWPETGVERNLPWDEFEPRAEAFGATVYRRNSGVTPRVQLVRRARLTSSPDKVWRQEVSPLPVVETLGRSVSEPRTVDYGGAELRLVAEGRLGVTVDVDARASPLPVLVCFARPWLPGYRVELDGRRAELMRLDAIQPAVEVPAGHRTRVELTYRPAALRLGLLLSAVTVAALLAAFALPAVRRNRR